MRARWSLGIVAWMLGCGLFPAVGGLVGDAAGEVSFEGGQADAHVGFCASLSPAPTFCDDFDDGGALFAPWSSSTFTQDGQAALDDVLVRSPPNAMLTTMPPTFINGSYAAAYVTKTLGASAHQVTFAADVYVERADPATNGGGIMVVGFSGGAVRINMNADGSTFLLESWAPNQFGGIGPTFTLPVAAWMRLTIIANTDNDTASVTVDTGAGPVTVVPTSPAAYAFGAASPHADLGLWFGESVNVGWILHYDNVTIDVL